MEKLTVAQLEELLNERVEHREIIDDTKYERMIEKVETKSRKMVVKYGYDQGLKNEKNMYENVFKYEEKDPVLKRFASKKTTDNQNIIAMEWIDGIHPDFSNSYQIESVFTALGKWAANWSKRIDNGDFAKGVLSHFEVLGKLLKENNQMLKKLFGTSLMELLYHCLQQKEKIIDMIYIMPLTLDPGDISLHNTIIKANGEVYFIDFESCEVRPMVMLVEHLGEDFESIPYQKSDVQLALQSYINAWNEFAEKGIDWQDFVSAYHSARIYYIIGDFNYWINRILEGENTEETMAWVQEGQKRLQVSMTKFNIKQ